MAQAILLTPVKALVARVREQIAKQLKTLDRAAHRGEVAAERAAR